MIKCVLSCICSLPTNLLVCGDIESNPGPTEKEMLEALLAGQAKTNEIIEAIRSNQNVIESKISTLTERVQRMDQQLLLLNKLGNQVSEIETSVSNFEQGLSSLSRKVDDLENRSRRNNLILHGLDEVKGETGEELLTRVKDKVFQEKLQLTAETIERCHRLGKKQENKSRPVIMRFMDYREKESVLMTAHKLKDTPFSLSEDFSFRVREIRRKLWKSAVKDKEDGAKVKLIYDKLSINSVLFGWDELNDSRFRITNKQN